MRPLFINVNYYPYKQIEISRLLEVGLERGWRHSKVCFKRNKLSRKTSLSDNSSPSDTTFRAVSHKLFINNFLHLKLGAIGRILVEISVVKFYTKVFQYIPSYEFFFPGKTCASDQNCRLLYTYTHMYYYD